MGPRTRHRIGIALAATGTVLLAVQLRPSTTHHSAPAPSVSAPIAIAGTSAEAHDRSGAIAAALRMLELTEDAPQLGPDGASEAQRSVSTGRSADALAADVRQVLGDLLAAYPNLRIHLAPLAWNAVADGDGWRVSVWYVETLELGDSVIDDWRTVTYTLRWEREQWLIDARTSVRGPVPTRATTLTATPARDFAAALAGFDDGR